MGKSNYVLKQIPKNLENLKLEDLIFQKIMDISTDGFLIVDNNSQIIGINKAYCKFLDVKREAVVSKNVMDVILNSKLPDILLSGETEVDVVHELMEGQSPAKEKVVAVTRAPVMDGKQVIAAVGQIKFSRETQKLAEKLQHMDSELKYYKDELKRMGSLRYSFENIIGKSQNFLKTVDVARKAAMNDFNVLILGDTGTGKEVFANAIHYASARRNKPIIRLNCAAIPAELLESELFGYEEGSFTGAKRGGKKGKFELASGGTIFLDEIGDMPLNMQAKLLRVLQEHEIEKIGGSTSLPINVRVIAATNQNLEERIKNKAFRLDLYYRLNVIQIKIPPLKERVDDIELFVNHFLQEINEDYKTKVDISPEALEHLNYYSWPGNIRELKNVIERSYSVTESNTILNSHLPADIIRNSAKLYLADKNCGNFEKMMDKIEKDLLLSFLKKNKNNCQATAKELGIHRSTLYKKFDKLNIKQKGE